MVGSHPTLQLNGHWLSFAGQRRSFDDHDRQYLSDLADRYVQATSPTHKPDELSNIGRALWKWLDGTQGWAQLLSDDTTNPIVEVSAPLADTVLLDAPWELLQDDDGFLTHRGLCPVRRLQTGALAPATARPASTHALSVLFMAAAPTGVATLAFEAEEVSILNATEGLSLDLHVEETGTAAELGHHLVNTEHTDVLHLTCHGSADGKLLLEDEYGGTAPTGVPDLLAELGSPARALGLCFLSACHTASPMGAHASAREMVKRGVPAVLGWSGAVSDTEATHFAAALYKHLSRGETLPRAVQCARRDLVSQPGRPSRDWHLARLLLGPMAPTERLANPRGKRQFTRNPGQKAFLDARRNAVPVASTAEFVGRRRPLQRILRTLRSAGGKRGALLTGVGRQGKSSLALRLLRRMPDHRPAVCHGAQQFDAQSVYETVRDALGLAGSPWDNKHRLRISPNTPGALEMALREALDAEAKGDAAFEPLLLVLDDVEQVLDKATVPVQVHANAQPVFQAILRAFDTARQTSRGRLLLTSRFAFRLDDTSGNDLVDRVLQVHPLPGMRDADSRKLLSARQSTSTMRRERCITQGRGNPGLTDRLLRLATTDSEAADEALTRIEARDLSTLADTDLMEWVQSVALDAVLSVVDAGTRALLDASTLFEVPVPLTVADALREAALVEANPSPTERLLALGLWERQPDLVDPSHTAFAVNALVRAQCLQASDEDSARALAHAVLPSLTAIWGPKPDEANAAYQLTRLAVWAGDADVANANASRALAHLNAQNQYPQATTLAGAVLRRLEEHEVPPTLGLLLQALNAARVTGDGDTQNRALTIAADRLDALTGSERAYVLRHLAARAKRQGDIARASDLIEDAACAATADGNDRLHAICQGEFADILFRRGELDEALRIRTEEELPVYERLGDVRSRTVTLGQIADIHFQRRDLDEALRIRTKEQLPVFEQLGDVRARAITLGQIADIQFRRGDLDEALRTWTEELLPVFEQLGDVRLRAVTLGKIADIHFQRRDLDEALRIRTEEQLPVFEQLGDVHSRAITLGAIADIRFQRGDLDEALRIRTEEELPIYERLGDVRARAVTLAKIADIHFQQKNLDEALRIRTEEELPVFEQLGDVSEYAITLGAIADIHHQRGDLDEALRIRTEEQLPVYERLGDVRSRTVTLGQIADIRFQRGDLDEALRIRTEEVLPVYERLGDVRSLLIARANVAGMLLQRGRVQDMQHARTLLLQAHAVAQELKLARELAQLNDMLEQLDATATPAGAVNHAQKIYDNALAAADVRTQAIALQNLAVAIYKTGDLTRARDLVERGLLQVTKAGIQEGIQSFEHLLQALNQALENSP